MSLRSARRFLAFLPPSLVALACAEPVASDGTESDTTGADMTAGDPEATPAECIPSQAHFVGSIEGDAIDAAYMWWGFFTDAGTVAFDLGAEGTLVLHELAYAESPEPAGVRGWLRMPAEDPRAGTWYCIGEGSQYVTDAEVESVQATLVDVTALGACPGTPVPGSIAICHGDPMCGGERAVTGDLDGRAFTTPLGETVGVFGPIDGTEFTIEHMFGDTSGGWTSMHAIDVTADPAPAVAPIDRAVFTMPDGLPDAGAIYCGSGSVTHLAGEPLMIELDEIARIGSCADALRGSTIDLCMSR